MPIFDEAAAVEAPKEGSPEYLVMVCHQHMAWLTVYAEGMTQADWRDMQDRLVSQIGKLVTDFDALAALKPYLGGEAPQNESAFDEIKRLRREIGRRQMRLQFLVLGDPTKGVSGRAQTLLDEIAASPDKGGE